MENFKHLPEPFRIRVIEPVKRTTRAYREEAIIKSGMNPFLLDSEDVFIDLLTDSGTGAVTQSMQAAMMRGDEAYSGSRSYYALAESVKNIFGYQYTIPTHQGRGAEQIYIPVLIKKREQEKGLDRSKMVAFSNYFFDTTQGHSQINGCTVRNVYIKEAFDTGVRYDFKGNFDLEGLERGIEEVGPNNVPYIVATITSNSAGGQPVSLANLKAMYSIAKKYDIPVVMDSARFAENAYFIKMREEGYQDKTIKEITREMFSLADGMTMSAKKDGIVNMGGFIATRRADWYEGAKGFCVQYEGYLTYGGMNGRDMNALAIGLDENTEFDNLETRIKQVEYLAKKLDEYGIPYQRPAGGHAIFIDAPKVLTHVPKEEFPAQTLTIELYLEAGIRGCEIGYILADRDPVTHENRFNGLDLLRLAIPRRVYTDNHMNVIAAALKNVYERRESITHGVRIAWEAPLMRHFTVQLERL